MAFGQYWAAGFWVRLWMCCGRKWIKILTRPESYEYYPTCDNCGECGDWPLKD